MNGLEVGPEFHKQPETTITFPMSELLQNPSEVARLWPEYSLTEQIEKHVAIINAVNTAIDSLPDPTISIESAIESGEMSNDTAKEMYTSLSILLYNSDYRRLALYLPFTILPESSWRPEDPALHQLVEHFKLSYLNAWHELLSVHDVRANFVDGDVLEEEYRDGDLARVVKAAHLIPELINRGLLTTDQITKLQTTHDPVLKHSINEALGLLYGLPSVFPKAPLFPLEGEMTERRRAWLEQTYKEKTLQATAQHVATAIRHGRSPESFIDPLYAVSDPDTAAQTLIEGICQAIVLSPLSQAKKLYEAERSLLEEMWNSDNDQIKDQLVSGYRRLHRKGVVSLTDLTDMGISLPTLSGPFSENLPELSADLEVLANITQTIEANPQLNAVLFPVVIVGGSKLKGYGGLHSDIDVSVFIKPGVPKAAHEAIREQLETLFVHGDTNYEPMEFWLESTNGQLTVRDLPEPTLHTADRYWTHSLFGGAWVGNQHVITELQQQLLPTYFQDTNETIHGVSNRQLYLERLEQDVLQYRLMHKGYQRHYPLAFNPSETIDGSIFWDPGFRQLATKLFVSNVFLPNIDS